MKIVNASLQSGNVPSDLKHALVTPLHKRHGLDTNNFANYRPVSKIVFVSKALERYVANDVREHVDNNDEFRVCLYMNSNIITLWSKQCIPHAHDKLYWNNNKTRPSLVHSRETITTGTIYAPSKHKKCAKTQNLTENSNKSPTQ